MSAAYISALVEFSRSGRVAQSLSEMGVEPEGLRGKYFELEDALYRDEAGWYVVANSINGNDGTARLYFEFETDGTRIEWN